MMSTLSESSEDVAETRALKQASRLGRFLVILAITLAILATTLWFFGASNVVMEDTGNRWRQIIWIIIYVFCLAGFIAEPTKFRVFSIVNPWLMVFILFAGLTVTWAIEPFVAFKRWIQLVGLIWTAGAAVSFAKPPINIVNWMRWPLAVLVVLSLIAAIAWPEIGQSHVLGVHGWQGVATSKNVFGQLCMTAALIWLPFLRKGFFQRLLQIVILVLILVCLWFSQSTTSLVSFFLGIAVMAILTLLQTSRRHGWHLFVLGGLVGALVIAYVLFLIRDVIFTDLLTHQITTLLGKDMTLTGRTHIWQIVWNEIQTHPLWGAGYGSTWINGGHADLQAYFQGMSYEVEMGHAHNGYLDLISDTGFIGFLLILAVLVTHSFRLARLYLLQSGPVPSLCIALFVVFLFTNITESMMFVPDLQTLILLISVVQTDWLLMLHSEAQCKDGQQSQRIILAHPG